MIKLVKNIEGINNMKFPHYRSKISIFGRKKSGVRPYNNLIKYLIFN